MTFDHGAPFLILLAASVVLLPIVLASIGRLPGARVVLSRSILVHAGCARAWDFVVRVPAVHAGHGRIREFGRVTEWSLREGDGQSAGSVWRVLGTWGSSPYWADIEILRVVPGSGIAIRLRRDSLGTHRGLRDHLCAFSLEPIDAGSTKITWRLEARLRGPGLLLARFVFPRRLRARLLDQALRSLKVEIDDVAKREERPASPPAGEDVTLDAPPPGAGRIPPESTL